MLSKLGWNKGEALGKANDGSGLLEPVCFSSFLLRFFFITFPNYAHVYYNSRQINVASNEGKTGLGCGATTSVNVGLTNADKRKIATWKKTQARYQQTDIFEDNDDSS